MAKIKRINNLTSINGCLHQMRRVYCEARTMTPPEAMDVDTATKLTAILKTITSTIRDNELERRIESIENDLKR